MLSDLWNRLIAATGSLVSPDWGSLVALIPLLLLVVVGAFVVITAVKWANAGPRTRARGRRQPLAPDGTPLRGPSRAPMVIAAGAFILAVGLVAGGPWLAAGIGLSALGLLWWALEIRLDSRPAARSGPLHGDAKNGGESTSPTPRRVTPARLAIVGVVAIAVVVLIATAKVVPDAPGTSTIPTIPPATPGPTMPAADAQLTAAGIAFVPPEFTAPAGRAFTVAFDNRDNAPHNLEIRDAAGTVLFLGDIVSGPVITVYSVPALAAGRYPFLCTVHPGMTGTLTAK